MFQKTKDKVEEINNEIEEIRVKTAKLVKDKFAPWRMEAVREDAIWNKTIHSLNYKIDHMEKIFEFWKVLVPYSYERYPITGYFLYALRTWIERETLRPALGSTVSIWKSIKWGWFFFVPKILTLWVITPWFKYLHQLFLIRDTLRNQYEKLEKSLDEFRELIK